MARMYFLNCTKCDKHLATTKEAEIEKFKKEHGKHDQFFIGY